MPGTKFLIQNQIFILKKLTLLSLTLGVISISFAQMKYSFKAGVTQSFVKESLASSYQSMNLKSGFQVGAALDISLVKNLILRPAFQLTQKGFKAVEGKFEGPFYWNRNISTTYFELPIDIVYNVPLSKSITIFMGTGPVISMGLFGEGKGVIKTTDGAGQLTTQEGTNHQPFKKPGYKIIDFGADFLSGIQFHRVIVAINYNYGLLNILNYDHGIQTSKNRSFAFTIGYFICK